MTDTPPNNPPTNTAQKANVSGQRPRPRLTLYRIAFPLAFALIRMFWASYRVKRVLGDEHLDAALEESSAIIPCLWHQHLMLCVPYLLRKRERGLKLGFMISPSVDGEAGAMAAQRFGGHIVRGSSSYTGARALRDFYMAVAKDKISLLITPDGPRGPRYEAKIGALLIAQLSGKPIVPLAYAANRVFKFSAWDRFILPLPFARIVLAVGEPIHIPKVMSPAELEAMRVRLQDILKRLFEQARGSLSSE